MTQEIEAVSRLRCETETPAHSATGFQPNRRSLIVNTLVSVASLASAAAVAAPAIAVLAPDPIFALIERHRAAAAHYRTTSPDIDRDEDDAAELADCEALRDLLGTAPTTLAGCAAVLRYFSDYLDEDDAPIGHWIEPYRSAGANFMPTVAGAIEKLLRQHGAALAGLAVAPTVPDPDSHLLSLEKKLKSARRRCLKQQKEEESLRDRIDLQEASLPPLPECPQPPAEYAELWKVAKSDELDRLPKDHPLAVWRRETKDQREKIWDLRRERQEELEERSGAKSAQEKWENTLHKEMWPIADEIWATPARTPKGTMVKIRAMDLIDITDGEWSTRWFRSIRADINRMSKQQSSVEV